MMKAKMIKPKKTKEKTIVKGTNVAKQTNPLMAMQKGGLMAKPTKKKKK
jgi:hypothetical protein